jgi:hypothetical protein
MAAAPSRSDTVKAVETKRAAAAAPAVAADLKPVDPSMLKESLLAEVQKAKKFFFNTVIAQAQKIELERDKVVFTFSPQHRALRAQLEQNRPYLETTASQLAGRKMTVAAAEGSGGPASPAAAGFGGTPSAADAASAGGPQGDKKQELKDRALADTGVQTMLDVFAAEIKDVEEM